MTVYISLFIFLVYTYLFNTVRGKLMLFNLLSIFFSIWGFFFYLDGFFLIFLLTELTIFLLLLMVYVYIYSSLSFFYKAEFKLKGVWLLPLVIILACGNSYWQNLVYDNTYFLLYQVATNDFYVLYFFLFNELGLVTVIITLLISLYSLYFIMVFFSLKKLKNQKFIKIKNLDLLKKQNLTKQTKFVSKVYLFQS